MSLGRSLVLGRTLGTSLKPRDGLLVVLGAEEGSSLTLIVGAILKDGIELGTLLGCELGYSVAKMSVIFVTRAHGTRRALNSFFIERVKNCS